MSRWFRVVAHDEHVALLRLEGETLKEAVVVDRMDMPWRMAVALGAAVADAGRATRDRVKTFKVNDDLTPLEERR